MSTFSKRFFLLTSLLVAFPSIQSADNTAESEFFSNITLTNVSDASQEWENELNKCKDPIDSSLYPESSIISYRRLIDSNNRSQGASYQELVAWVTKAINTLYAMQHMIQQETFSNQELAQEAQEFLRVNAQRIAMFERELKNLNEYEDIVKLEYLIYKDTRSLPVIGLRIYPFKYSNKDLKFQIEYTYANNSRYPYIKAETEIRELVFSFKTHINNVRNHISKSDKASSMLTTINKAEVIVREYTTILNQIRAFPEYKQDLIAFQIDSSAVNL